MIRAFKGIFKSFFLATNLFYTMCILEPDHKHRFSPLYKGCLVTIHVHLRKEQNYNSNAEPIIPQHHMIIINFSGTNSSKMSACRNASTARSSSTSRISSIETELTRPSLFLLLPFFRECLNLLDAFSAFLFNEPIIVLLSSPEFSKSDFLSLLSF